MTATEKRGISFPSAYTVLFIVLILAAAVTYLIPAGKYSKFIYNGENQAFLLESPKGEISELPATQSSLDKLGVNIDLKEFTDGTINKPVAIPDTYERLEANPTEISEFFMAPIKGFEDSQDIMLFVLILGGIIGVLNMNGSITAGFAALSRATDGKEFILVVLVTFFIALGGTTFGMAEETIALYPIIIPIFLAAGYDAMVGIAAIYLGSSIGTTFSTVNVFSTGIGSAAAGTTIEEGLNFRIAGLAIGLIIVILYILRYASKVKKDPTKSIIYAQRHEVQAAMNKNAGEKAPPFTFARAFMLLILLAAFGYMIYGVSKLEWWFSEMSREFLVVGIILILITVFFTEFSERETISSFVSGAADLVGVGLIIGLARSVNFLLEEGLVSDTILYSATQMVSGMSPALFIIMMMLIFIVLGFFIPSSSGLAVLSMPIMAPLADTVGLPRDTIVSAYQYGQGLMAFITPTGLILVVLSLVHVTFDKWLKFVIPLVIMIAILAVGMLLAQVYLG